MLTKFRMIVLLVLAGCLFGIGAVPALAQIPTLIPVPVELEGPISAVVDNGNGSGSIVVMGVTVQIPATAVIHTPTATLTIAQLADPTPLPGRTQPGFVGGTAIILGQTDGVATTAEDVFAEPAENVLLGVITRADGCTATDCTNLEVLGTQLLRLTDPRLPANPPANAFGFQVDLSQGALVGSPASVEGYYGQVAVPPSVVPALHYFIVELDGGALLNPGVTEVSILRAQCRERDNGIELDVLGATHDPGTGIVTISNTNDPNEVFGTANVVPDLVLGTVGTYNFQLQGNLGFVVCPDGVTATFEGATAEAAVDVIERLAGAATTPVMDFAVTPAGTPVVINVLANDPGVGLQIVSVTQGANGTVAINPGNTTVTYTPNPGFAGFDTFTYTTANGTAAVTVTVAGAPVQEVITITAARYRTATSIWRINGTTTVPGPGNTMIARLIRTRETIGTGEVDALGNFTIRVVNSPVVGLAGDIIRVFSSGGNAVRAPVTILP
jgi:hypothetical protein